MYTHIRTYIYNKVAHKSVFLQMTDTTKVEKCCRGNEELLIIQCTCMQAVFKKMYSFLYVFSPYLFDS